MKQGKLVLMQQAQYERVAQEAGAPGQRNNSGQELSNERDHSDTFEPEWILNPLDEKVTDCRLQFIYL
jgi:hypothetical protein